MLVDHFGTPLVYGNESREIDGIAVSSVLRDAVSYITHDVEHETLSKAGFQKEETFARCSYNGIKCNLDEMKQFYDAQYGNCFIFNWNGSRSVARAGASTGKVAELIQ